MDLTTKVLDDSSLLLKSSNSFVEISSDLSDSSSEPPNSDNTMSVAFTLDHDSDSETEAFDSAAEKLLSYEELMEKYVHSEEELKTTSLKLQESEQEIEIQKNKAQKKESDLRVELENSYIDYIKLMDEYEECDKELRTTSLKLRTAQKETETKNIILKVIKRVLNELQGKISELEKESEMQMQSYRNLMEVNDDKTAAISLLKAILGSSNREINHLKSIKSKLEHELGNAKNTVEKLRDRVKELEKEAEVERNTTKNKVEELRDTIKVELEYSRDCLITLCSSLAKV